MLAVVKSATNFGIDAIPIRVEVDLSPGLPGFATVGLPENTVKESRVRVQAAILNSGYEFPAGRITVNLAPANLRKEGTGFDLAIALGIMAAQGIISLEKLSGAFVLGELSLSGEVKPVRGVLAAAQVAFNLGSKFMLVAPENAAEAALVEGLNVLAVHSFKDMIDFFLTNNKDKAKVVLPTPFVCNVPVECHDMSDVRGQYQARRALEVAAAGGHNLIMVGGPGSGKTMLAQRMPGILPPLSYQEAIEVTQIYSAAGLTVGTGLISNRPFRSPHHSITRAGLIGGGSGIPRPGELSLASNGVLFLDELPEFTRHVLEVLRQPLESGEVLLSRANAVLSYPAKIMLVAAMNPCPCGNWGSPKRKCSCSAVEVNRYKNRLSGPLLDRIDLHVEVPPVDLMALQSTKPGESSAQILNRVCLARKIQQGRLRPGITNATMSKAELVATATPTGAGQKLLGMAMERLGLSARAYDRVLRVARTIADLKSDHNIESEHIAEALQYRGDECALLAA
ncbi:MAG: YifB family Mg chelatase-like AAA ATPase [bacterium]|nr:YifB family Mg chelatase-like AAA ATPase [bacterium]